MEPIEIIGEPLDARFVDTKTKHGVDKHVPALHIGFAEDRRYVHYIAPTDNTEERKLWLDIMDCIDEDLTWLLLLSYQRFWSQASTDNKLMLFLESYLSKAPRIYDFEKVALNEDMQDIADTIHNKLLRVFIRMGQHIESQTNHMTKEAWIQIIYNQYLFDIPKLLDLCVLYNEEHHEHLVKIFRNVFTNEAYYEDLKNVLPYIITKFNEITDKIEKKNSRSNFRPKQKKNNLRDMFLPNIQQLIVKLVDTLTNLYHFFDVYGDANLNFGMVNICIALPYLYLRIIFSIEEELNYRINLQSPEDFLPTCEHLELASDYFLRIVDKIKEHACLVPITQQKNLASTISGFGNYSEILKSILSVKEFFPAYKKKYCLSNDIPALKLSIYKPNQAQLRDLNGYFFAFDENHYDLTEEDFGSQPREDLSYLGACSVPSLDIIGQIKEIHSGLSDNTIKNLLEYYNNNAEEVISAIFENNLPTHLEIIENEVPLSTSEALTSRPNIYDNDEFDIFHNSNIDKSKIHIGKKHKELEDLNQDTEFKMLMKEKNVLLESSALYEDEYDDTYDAIDVRAQEYCFEDELGKREESGNESSDSDKESINPNQNQLSKTSSKKNANFYSNIKNEPPKKHYEVKGNAKGQGQSQEVLKNRQHKEKNKTYMGNHNRKEGASHKRRQGMF